jgi:hypothetical protein
VASLSTFDWGGGVMEEELPSLRIMLGTDLFVRASRSDSSVEGSIYVSGYFCASGRFSAKSYKEMSARKQVKRVCLNKDGTGV